MPFYYDDDDDVDFGDYYDDAYCCDCAYSCCYCRGFGRCRSEDEL